MFYKGHYLLFPIAFLLIGLIKSNGQQTQWAIGIEGQSANAIFSDSLGNVYTTGSFIGNVDFDPGPGVVTLPHNISGNNSYITKMDSAGNLIWARGLAGVDLTAWGVVVDKQQNVYVSGLFYSSGDFNPDTSISFILTATNPSAGNPDIFILKLNDSGHFVWAHKIGTGGFESAGNLCIDNNANIYVMGRFSNTCDFDPGPGTYNLSPAITPAEEVYVARYDSAGFFNWAVSSQLSYYGEFESLGAAYDNLGNIFVGSYNELAKIDTTGNLLYKKQFNNNPVTTQLYLYIKSLSCDSSGHVYACGGFSDTADFDTDSLISYYLISNTSQNSFVCKLNNNLDFNWALSFPEEGNYLNNSYNTAYSIKAIDSAVYVVGLFTDTININTQSNVNFLIEHDADTLNNFYDAYVVKYSSNGNFLWGERFGGSRLDRSKVINSNVLSVFVAGDFSDTADFNNGPVNQTLMFSGVGNFSVFILKFNSFITSISENDIHDNYYVYPSPCANEIMVSKEIKNDFAAYQLSDVTGKTIVTGNLANQKIVLENLKPGIYFIRFSNNKNTFTARFIKI